MNIYFESILINCQIEFIWEHKGIFIRESELDCETKLIKAQLRVYINKLIVILNLSGDTIWFLIDRTRLGIFIDKLSFQLDLSGNTIWFIKFIAALRKKTGIGKQDPEANIWDQEGWECGVEKAPQWGTS